MKIIQKGVDPATQPIMATCNNCKTTVEFLPSEATYRSDQRDGDYYLLDCPVCNRAITRNVRNASIQTWGS